MASPSKVITDANNEVHKLLLKDLRNRPDGIKSYFYYFKAPIWWQYSIMIPELQFSPHSGVTVIAN